MAFCKYCGKELKEGEVCSCQTPVAEAPTAEAPAEEAAPAAAEPVAEAAAETEAPAAVTAEAPAGEAPQQSVSINLPDKEQVTAAAKSVWKGFLGVYTHPVSGGKAFVASAGIVESVCFMLVQALLSSIFACVVVGKVNGLFALGMGYLDSLKFSGVKAFFLTFLFSALFSGVLLLLFWLAQLILRVKAGWKQLLALTAVRSVAVIPFIIISIILGLLNPVIGAAVFFGSAFLALCFLLEAVKGLGEMQEDKALYTVFAVMFLFVMIFVLVASKACALYIPASFKNLGNLSNMFF